MVRILPSKFLNFSAVLSTPISTDRSDLHSIVDCSFFFLLKILQSWKDFSRLKLYNWAIREVGWLRDRVILIYRSTRIVIVCFESEFDEMVTKRKRYEMKPSILPYNNRSKKDRKMVKSNINYGLISYKDDFLKRHLKIKRCTNFIQ